jgi:glycosyltransferase involved in cell wall biosynthesis
VAGGRIRLAHLVSHALPYQVPLYRELSRRPEVDLTVFFYSDASVRGYRDVEFGREVRWDTALLDGYRYRHFASGARTPVQPSYGLRPNRDLLHAVLSEGHDAVWAHGYAWLNVWLVATLAPERTALLLRDDQTLIHGRPWYRAALKNVALRRLFGRSWGLYVGEQNRRYFLQYGMAEERLFPARHCVDNDFFQREAERLRPERRSIRARFGIRDDAPVLLFSGKLIPKKDPLLLIEAFERVRSEHECWLLLVGDGELREQAADVVARRRIPDVRFAGFLNQTEIPAAYAAADVFVLPSSLNETWGLVVNEAMNFSLPLVVSDKVGSAEDLVREGWNGVVFPSGDAAALAATLARLVADPELRSSFGRRSLERVGEYSVSACADGIVAACVAATARSETA